VETGKVDVLTYTIHDIYEISDSTARRNGFAVARQDGGPATRRCRRGLRGSRRQVQSVFAFACCWFRISHGGTVSLESELNLGSSCDTFRQVTYRARASAG
jgi:hypothetical protein